MSRPKMSIGTWAFAFGPFEKDPWPLSKVLEYAAGVGYDGVELNGFRPHVHQDDYDTLDRCAELRREIEGFGLGISGYAPELSQAPPALVETEVYLQTVRKCLFVCEHCGIEILRVDTVSPPEELPHHTYEQRFAQLVRTWNAAAEEAARAGVSVVWEFEPGFWLNKPSEVRRVVEAVASENFWLLFDTSHAYMGAVVGARHTGQKELLPGGVVEYAQSLRDAIGHLHLIDSNGTLHDSETSTHAPFGQGFIDFEAVLSSIKPVVSKMKWWCADFCFNPEAEAAGREAVPFLRNLVEAMQ